MTAQAYYTASSAARYAKCSPTIVYRGLRNTGADPKVFPPPLEYVGRKGEDGPYVISHEQLVAWIASWSRFG